MGDRRGARGRPVDGSEPAPAEPAGPVLVFAVTDARQVAAPSARFDTAVLRLVVDGSCTIGDRAYEAGDIRVPRSGTWCPPVVAGDLARSNAPAVV